MNKKILIGFSIFIIGILLLTTVGKAEEEFTKVYFSDKLSPGNEIKWNVKTLVITGDLTKEFYFELGNYNLSEGDVIKIVVEEDPDNLPQPDGWLEQDWFDVYVNDILVYENSSEFYSEFEEPEEDFMLPNWFVLPSQLENSTGTYYVTELLYEYMKPYENHTTTSTSESYPPYQYEMTMKADLTVEKDADSFTVRIYMYMNFTMVDTANNKVYYVRMELNGLYRLNKDGIADQYYLSVKLESVVPTASESYVLQQMEQPGNGTVEFNVVREGYTPPAEGGGTNTFTIPFSVLGPILGVIAVGVVLRRKK